MPTATISRRYYIGEAAAYIARKTGVELNIREFRFLIARKHIPFLKSPGPFGHHFWVQSQLDEIAAKIMENATWPTETEKKEPRKRPKK